MEEIPFFDPITGEYRPMLEPVLTPETSTLIVETQFLVYQDTVVSWKSKGELDKTYN
ncbi:hypothetical protein VDG1235_2281 [Verrucomicrobiia bacterium DG1235]|nr:hypothetical protein VDG1235_2281 [Verrucomicrobiae bacterium DG1235]